MSKLMKLFAGFALAAGIALAVPGSAQAGYWFGGWGPYLYYGWPYQPYAFNYPRRARFFRVQLEEFLLLNWEEKTDPQTALGSYAGAVGMAQFMPDNVRRLAVDYDGDGVRDLANSPADAIGSIGNFLRAKGWSPNQPVVQPLQRTQIP